MNMPLFRDADILLEIVFKTMRKFPDENSRELAPNVFLQDGRIYAGSFWRDGEYIIRREPVGRGEPCQLFIPEDFTEIFCHHGKWLNYLGLERLILPFGRMILHASAVIYQGKAYLFSAPSGEGKSTQAFLWEKYLGAKLLNGDKVVIEITPDGAIAHGSPVAGSSGIYCNDSAPIAAVILLKKSLRNHISPVSERTAFLSLYSEAIKCNWDNNFNMQVLALAEQLQKKTPVYSLECLPEKSAVKCVLEKLERITP